jgi:hypothetical protein
LSDHIIYGTLSPSHYCSTGIDVVAAETDVRAFGWLRYLVEFSQH